MDKIVYKEMLEWISDQWKKVKFPERLVLNKDGTLMNDSEFEKNKKLFDEALEKQRAWNDLLRKLYKNDLEKSNDFQNEPNILDVLLDRDVIKMEKIIHIILYINSIKKNNFSILDILINMSTYTDNIKKIVKDKGYKIEDFIYSQSTMTKEELFLEKWLPHASEPFNVVLINRIMIIHSIILRIKKNLDTVDVWIIYELDNETFTKLKDMNYKINKNKNASTFENILYTISW